MCIFQSKQVIKLRNVMVSLVKTNGHRIRQISEIGLSCVRHDAGMLSEIHAKTVQHCRADDCIAINMEWFATGFHCSSIRQSRHFKGDFDHVLLQLVDFLKSLNTERAAEIRRWNVGIADQKAVQSLIRYYWIFRPRDGMFTWKSELWNLNRCICWTT